MDTFVRGLSIALLPAMLAGLGSRQAGITRIEITAVGGLFERYGWS